MRITQLAVRNYRCLESLDLDIADYTALVGANGAGKSSVLYALDWFFRGYDLDESDLTQRGGVTTANKIQVSVTFGDLTARDRQLLGEYGRGDTARFRRTWTFGQKGTKVVGRALQGQGFSAVRQASNISAMRKDYRTLQQQVPGLAQLASNAPKDDILAALAEWEDEAGNHGLLVEVEDVNADHIFGISGTNVIRECVRLVLVPAATDMQSQLQDASKGSALAELIGAIISEAGNRARDEWLTEHAGAIQELNARVEARVTTSVTAQAARINAKLQGMVPDASVSFVPDVPQWVPKGDASISTSVTIDGSTNDIARQGHGVQRAVMIALFQSLVPEASDSATENGTDEAEVAPGPALIVCIEEPEIYQHPIRARSFARILSGLSDQPHAQVMIATHSPYFVSPSQFDSIRRFRMGEGATIPSIASIQEVMEHANADEHSVRKIVQKRLPTTFSEGFFADAVVLVEGDTDRAVLESLAERLGMPLDERGISLLELGGKSGLRIPHAIFTSLDVFTYVIADGDADAASRITKGETSTDVVANRTNAEASNRASTEKLIAWLPEATVSRGTLPYKYGQPTVITDRYTIWRDDLEAELSAWPSFVTALEAGGGRLRHKNALMYRAAVHEADIADLPDNLRIVVEAIWGLGGRGGSVRPRSALVSNVGTS